MTILTKKFYMTIVMITFFFFPAPTDGLSCLLVCYCVMHIHMNLPRIPSQYDIRCHTDGRVGGEALFSLGFYTALNLVVKVTHLHLA